MIRRQTKLRRALSMTSLIDVIFLLLLFFMLTSTFSRFSDVPLVAASRGGAVQAGDVPPLFLRVTETGMSLNDVPVAELLPELEARAGEESRSLIVALASDSVTSQQLVDVLVAAQQVPSLYVQVVN